MSAQIIFWGYEVKASKIVDVYVCRLRAKIEKPLGRRMIRTVRGVGYTLET